MNKRPAGMAERHIMPLPKPHLVIFDCDGVLVDSEAIENQLLVDMAASHGVSVDSQAAHRDFLGRRLADCITWMEDAAGLALPETFITDYRRKLHDVIECELQPVAGAHAALEQMTSLTCVASNGPRPKIEQALRVTGLRRFFQDRLFSAYDIDAWKPAPDLFLHAAGAMGVAPSDCVVVEDSPLGVEAARAAGMQVVLYAPAGNALPGAVTLTEMGGLPILLAQ